MATYLIGDIQGCHDALARMLDKIQFDPASDHLWCPGDLVNRGGQSLETLRLLKSISGSFTMTLGNHDLYLLADHHRFPEGGSRNAEFEAILQAPDREELMEWIRFQSLAKWFPDQGILMVHAGVIPQWTVKKTLSCAAEIETVLQSPKIGKFFGKMRKNWVRKWHDDRTGWRRRRLISNILTQLRFCDGNGKILSSPSGPPGTQPKGYRPWFKHKNRKTRKVIVAFGLWAALGLHLNKRLPRMDTGCVWGGRLTTIRIEDRQVFQVPGKILKN